LRVTLHCVAVGTLLLLIGKLLSVYMHRYNNLHKNVYLLDQMIQLWAYRLPEEMTGVEGEVDRAAVPPLPGHPINGPPRLSIFGKMPLINIPPL